MIDTSGGSNRRRARSARGWQAALVAAAAQAIGAGCGGGDPSLDSYFDAPTYSTAACNATDTALQGQRQVALYRSGSVNLLGITHSLQRYYRRHDLQFVTMAQPASAGQS